METFSLANQNSTPTNAAKQFPEISYEERSVETACRLFAIRLRCLTCW
jgi:hypothetical protein